MEKITLSIFVPCFNEERNIANTLNNIQNGVIGTVTASDACVSVWGWELVRSLSGSVTNYLFRGYKKSACESTFATEKVLILTVFICWGSM